MVSAFVIPVLFKFGLAASVSKKDGVVLPFLVQVFAPFLLTDKGVFIMPKHINVAGSPVSYHSMVIRFTARQFEVLCAMKRARGNSINEIVRKMTDREIEVFLVNSPNK